MVYGNFKVPTDSHLHVPVLLWYGNNGGSPIIVLYFYYKGFHPPLNPIPCRSAKGTVRALQNFCVANSLTLILELIRIRIHVCVKTATDAFLYSFYSLSVQFNFMFLNHSQPSNLGPPFCTPYKLKFCLWSFKSVVTVYTPSSAILSVEYVLRLMAVPFKLTSKKHLLLYNWYGWTCMNASSIGNSFPFLLGCT